MLLIIGLTVGQRVFAQQRGKALELSYTSPKVYTLGRISFEGNQHLRPQTLRSLIDLAVGDQVQLPGEAFHATTRKLWEQGLLDNLVVRAYALEDTIAVEESAYPSIELVFEVQERLRVTMITFDGLTRGQTQTLKKDIDKFKRKIVNNIMRQNIIILTKNMLKKKGYLNPAVEVITTPDTVFSGGAVLVIKVQRGKQTTVRDIHFYGAEDIMSNRLLKQHFQGVGERLRVNIGRAFIRDILYGVSHPGALVKSWFARKKKWAYDRNLLDELSPHISINIFKSRKLDQKKYDEGLASLQTYIQSKGFRDVALISDSLLFHSQGIDVEFRYIFGNKHYIGDIKWVGNHVYSDSALAAVLGIERGELYNPSFLERRLFGDLERLDVSTLYQDNGYLYFRISPIESRVARDTVDLEMRIYEGLPAEIASVRVVGNDRTRDHVFLRELYTVPGQIFRRTDILQSQQRLNQLGYVDPEETKPIPVPIPEDQTVDIEWQVQEKSSDQIELSGGWGGGVGLIGSIGFVLNNFSLRSLVRPSTWNPLPIGDGQKLAIRLRSNGPRFFSLSTSFSEPWLGGRRRNNFSVGYTLSREQYFSTGGTPPGSFVLHGVNIGLLRSLSWPDDYFSLGYSVSYRNYRLRNASSRSLGFNTGQANNLAFNVTLSRSQIDNPTFPTRGSLIALSVDFSPPYSTFNERDYNTLAPNERYKLVEYHKWIFDVKTYVELVKNLVIESRFHTGIIGKYTNRGADTPFERFSLGGDGITGQNFILGTDVIGLRGYENSSITPRDFVNNINGGRFFSKVTFELRYKVLQTGGGTIYVLTFAEGGNNLNDFSTFSFFDIYRSAGIGVRALLPAVGFIGLDWGKALDRLPGQLRSGNEFHFIIGQTIR